MRLSELPLISREAIAERVDTLGAEIARDYDGAPPVLLIVLKGAVVFGADLMRALGIPVAVDFIRAQSYVGTGSTGVVQLGTRPTTPLHGRRVLLVEDILDTGRTAMVLRDYAIEAGAAEVRIVTLLDKPSRREVDIAADYTGFTIENLFVAGYGLDFDERFRELDAIFVLTP
jgi:hypoxanthine phosphoribosyltransferase